MKTPSYNPFEPREPGDSPSLNELQATLQAHGMSASRYAIETLAERCRRIKAASDVGDKVEAGVQYVYILDLCRLCPQLPNRHRWWQTLKYPKPHVSSDGNIALSLPPAEGSNEIAIVWPARYFDWTYLDDDDIQIEVHRTDKRPKGAVIRIDP